MLSIASGIAVLILTGWLMLTARLSQSPSAWQYNIWAMLVILLWAQPWSRSDPLRTTNKLVRGALYLLLFLAISAFWYVFGGLWQVIMALEVLMLFLIEVGGKPEISRE